jgi:tetratricopeptide (TPR) repeat protein
MLAGFQRSLALAPARADLWENISRFFLQLWPALSKTERRFAITCLEQALTLAPERTEAILATAFPVDPDLPAVLSGPDPRRGFAAARLYQRHGDTERARRQAHKIVARLQEEALGVRREGVRREEAFSSFLLLAEVQLFLGNKEEAREAYEQGLEQTTDPAVHKDFCWRLAAWHFERQDFVTAGDYYRRYLALVPNSPEAALHLGISSLRTGEREEGMRWVEQAAGMRLGDAGWQTQLARIFEEAGRYDRANKLYRRILARDGQPNPDLLLHLARNYRQLGLGQEALAAYQRLLAIDANNAEARAFIELVEGPEKAGLRDE